MKILVPVKRAIDYKVTIRVKPDGSGVDTDNVKMSMNPFDEIAVEQAVRLKEAGQASEVVVVSIGSPKAEDTIRTAMAIGADRGMLLTHDTAVEPLAVAKLLVKLVEEEQPGLVILGKQAIDNDANQTGQMLSALLGWGQATSAAELVVDGDSATVTSEIDGGLQKLRLTLPAIVTTELGLNQPRNATLPNVIKAKKKPLDVREASSLGVDLDPRLKVTKVTEPPARKSGIQVNSVEELVAKLRDEAQVL